MSIISAINVILVVASGHIVGQQCQSDSISPPAALFENQKEQNPWLGPVSRTVIDEIIDELHSKHYGKIVRQFNNASSDIQNCELIQFWRASAQCQYDVPGGLRFIRKLFSHQRKDEHLMAGFCSLADAKAKTTQEMQLLGQICDEFRNITRYPSQALVFRALIEHRRGHIAVSADLIKRARRLWQTESHKDSRGNPPIDIRLTH